MLNNNKIIKRYFLMPFLFSLSIILIFLSKLNLKLNISNVFILYIGFFFLSLTFIKYFKNLPANHKIKIIISKYIKYFFISTISLSFLINLEIFNIYKIDVDIKRFIYLLVILSIVTFLYIKKKENKINLKENEEETLEKIKKGEFLLKFPKINKIPILKNILKWFYKEEWFYSITLVIITSLFLIFGLNHLGKFMSVDEPKWLNDRVPQLFEAIKTQKWADTYINDKPGILPSLLSGSVNLFLNLDTYKENPLKYENYLFFWRIPILIFNFIMLFFIYNFTKKLLKKDSALLITGLIALNPILIGISQIVNPDATLWSVGFLSFVTFFLYLKTNLKKYIYYSGFFLGLALISKYFISIYYVVFPLIIYFEYLFKNKSINEFYSRCLDLSLLFLTSIITYVILFPATWTDHSQIIKGTIGSGILGPGIKYFLFLMFLIFTELILLNGKISKYIKQKNNIIKIIIFIISLFTFIIFIFLIINIFNGNYFFDFNQYILFEFNRGGVNIVNDLFTSFYMILLTTTPFLTIGFFGFIFIFFSKKYKEILEKNKLLILSSFLLIFIFIIGSSLGGFIASARYQIILYPIYSILFTVIILSFKKRRMGILIIFIISIFILFSTKPYYFQYENFLNKNNYKITDAWGFGGYELAQIINSLPDAKNINVWSDREGFNEFFIGTTYWRGKYNPFDEKNNIDYLILTKGGERIFNYSLDAYKNGEKFLYARVAGETSILEYYSKKPNYKICINKNVNNCIWATKVEK